MIDDKGIRSLLPPFQTDDEIAAQEASKAAVEKRLGPTTPKPTINFDSLDQNISFGPEFYKPLKSKKQLEDEKYKRDFERDYGDKAIKKDVRNKVNKNKRAGVAPYQNMTTSEVIIAESEPSIQRQVINYSPKKIDTNKFENKKAANGLHGQLMVDPKHPDGFRFTDAKDLYKNYGDNPERYVEELMYLYDDGPVPTAGVVKKFDNLDKDSYPMNQTKELKTYQKAFNQLTPVQKQQVLANKNKPKKI